MVLTFQAVWGRNEHRKPPSPPPTRTGMLKEEAGRPANYLAKTIYILTSTKVKAEAIETEFSKDANAVRFSPSF